MVKKKLAPKYKLTMRIGSVVSSLFLAFFFGIFISTIIISFGYSFGTMSEFPFLKISLVFIFIFLFFLVVSQIWVTLSYNRWFYEFTDNQLRIEQGVIWKKYSNIAYSRIQNIDILRGIFARLFGYSSLNIQTAGYSAMPAGRGSFSEGYIPAVPVKEAEEIREFLIKKITRSFKKQGL